MTSRLWQINVDLKIPLWWRLNQLEYQRIERKINLDDLTHLLFYFSYTHVRTHGNGYTLMCQKRWKCSIGRFLTNWSLTNRCIIDSKSIRSSPWVSLRYTVLNYWLIFLIVICSLYTASKYFWIIRILCKFTTI